MGGSGANESQLASPADIAVDAPGNLYIADDYLCRVQKFSAAGVLMTEWGTYGTAEGQLNAPSSIALDRSGNVYVADSGNGRLQKFSATGGFIAKSGGSIADYEGLAYPRGLAIDSTGCIYVGDGYPRIMKFGLTEHFWRSGATAERTVTRSVCAGASRWTNQTTCMLRTPPTIVL